MGKSERKGFLLYHSIRGVLIELTDEQRGRLFLASLDYSERGIVPAFGEPELRVAFAVVRSSIDDGVAAWESEKEQRHEAAVKGAKARWKKENPS